MLTDVVLVGGKERTERMVSWQSILSMVVVNKQRQRREKKESVYTTCVEIETFSRTQQQTMAVATSPRRETNARLPPAGHLETDGFTVKSLLKNAKVSAVETAMTSRKLILLGQCPTISGIDSYSQQQTHCVSQVLRTW